MPFVAKVSHLDRVRRLLDGQPDPAASPYLQRLSSSYLRSLDQHHLDPADMRGPRVLSSGELRQVQQGEEDFLRASGQCLSMLHQTVREADYCVMLTNAGGTTIDYRVDRERRHDFKRAGLYLGSCWSESEEGTCGVAAVLQDALPITVHKSDHFRAAFTTLTCSAAPIFSPSGELIGVLDASAIRSPDARDSQNLVNRIVLQSATLIEDGYFLNAMACAWVLLVHRSRHYVEAQPEILIAFDALGNIIAANRRARECIAGLQQLPRPMGEIFDLHFEGLLDSRACKACTCCACMAVPRSMAASAHRSRVRCVRPAHAAGTPAPAGSESQAIQADERQERDQIVAALTECKWRAPHAPIAGHVTRHAVPAHGALPHPAAASTLALQASPRRSKNRHPHPTTRSIVEIEETCHARRNPQPVHRPHAGNPAGRPARRQCRQGRRPVRGGWLLARPDRLHLEHQDPGRPRADPRHAAIASAAAGTYTAAPGSR
jgi:transcriptional regulator of acetoin/glycerol metabolism